MTTLTKVQTQVAAELAKREANISKFFTFLSEADLVMLAENDKSNPRYEFVVNLCEDVEKRGGDLDNAIEKYQKGPVL